MLPINSIILLQLVIFLSKGIAYSVVQDETTQQPQLLSEAAAEQTTTSDLISDDPGHSEKLDERVFSEFGKGHRPIFPVPDPNQKEENVIDLDYVPDHVKILTGNKANAVQKILTGDVQCGCGISNIPKIIGGKDADINHYPWTVGLVDARDNKLFCGGTVINSLYVLTASHCVQSYRRNPKEIYIALSKTKLEPAVLSTLGAGFKSEIEKIMMHPDYNPFTINNDVALIKLKSPVRLTKVPPICIPADEVNDFAGLNGTVVGWGTSEESSQDTTKNLQQITIPILTNRKCIEDTIDDNYDRVTSNMLCAGLLEQGGMDSCQGDSGGPLIVDFNNSGTSRGVLVGVVSWGVGCARPKSPGVYARVSRYVNWIKENTKDAQYCGGTDQI